MPSAELVGIFSTLFVVLSFIHRKDLFPGLYEKPMVSTALKLARDARMGKQRLKL